MHQKKQRAPKASKFEPFSLGLEDFHCVIAESKGAWSEEREI